nr:MAG: heat shock protein 70 [Plant associated crinivirus 1]
MVLFGLDFGTTFSSVCIVDGFDVVALVQNNSSYIPTSLFFPEDSRSVMYGYDAELLNSSGRQGSYYRDLKRWVGVTAENFRKKLNLIKPDYSIELTKAGTGLLDTVRMWDNKGKKNYSLPDLIASYMRCLIGTAESVFKVECTGVVCSVPAAYNTIQRSFTENCVTLAGWRCIHIINEPSAAALSALTRLSPDDDKLIVYDFGGGTFDVSTVFRQGNTMSVKKSHGDMNLGGRDVDKALSNYIKSKHNVILDKDLEVSFFKELFGNDTDAMLYKYEDASNEKREVTLSKLEMLDIIKPYSDRSVKILNEVAESSNFDDKSSISVIVVGGSSYLPGLLSRISSTSYVKRVVPLTDPRLAVAIGCAVFANSVTNTNDILLVDCASHTVGIPNFRARMIPICVSGSPIPFVGDRRISLSYVSQDGDYKLRLFEGDHVQCRFNTKIFSSDVLISDLRNNSQSSNLSLLVEVKVDSLGKISCKLVGEGKEVDLSSRPHYDFSSLHKPSRVIENLIDRDVNLGEVLLKRTHKLKYRDQVSAKDLKSCVNDGASLEDISKRILHGIDKDTIKRVDDLLTESFPGLVKGSRYVKLPLK